MNNRLFALVCLILFALLLTVPFTRPEPTGSSYYSNTFDSASSLNDGYWQLKDAIVVNGQLEINGEAFFNPQPGGYSLNNFTVQFDVYHNVRYANNTAYSGPFYQLCDSQNKTIILLGYFAVETNNETHFEGCFTNLMNYHHYYFRYNQTNDWATWRVTGVIQQMTGDGLYWGNFTLQINNETVTTFRSDSILPEGTVYSITNEIVNPIAYFNIYPLPQSGVMIIPTATRNNGIQYTPISYKVATIQNSLAIPSIVDNFLYGYANTVPINANSTITPTPTPVIPELSSIIIMLIAMVTVSTVALVKWRKNIVCLIQNY